jgi:hypothetical protein
MFLRFLSDSVRQVYCEIKALRGLRRISIKSLFSSVAYITFFFSSTYITQYATPSPPSQQESRMGRVNGEVPYRSLHGIYYYYYYYTETAFRIGGQIYIAFIVI